MSDFDYEALKGLTPEQQLEVQAEVRVAERAEMEEADRKRAFRLDCEEAAAATAAEMRAAAELDAQGGETWAEKKARLTAVILAERKAKWAAAAIVAKRQGMK